MQTLIDSIDAAIGCDYLRNKNQLFFVEYSGKVSRLDLVRSYDSTVSSGTTVLSGTGTFDLDTGTEAPSSGEDVWWQQVDSTERYMTPRGDAEIANLGVVNFGGVSHAELQNVDYSDDPIDGSDNASNKLVDGDVFAVKTTQGNLAKVRVVDYGYDIEIEWKTYKLDPAYNVIGTGYTNPEDIVLSSDGQHAYVTERGGDFLRIDLDNADRSDATVVSSGMTAPHQIALDESRGQAYVVEYTSSDTGELIRIDLTTGDKTTIHSGLDEAVGLLVDSEVESAYISEQSGNGRVIRVEIDSGRREEIVTGLDAPFFLEWADPDESAILTTERDPANRVSKVDLTDLSVVHLFSGVPFRPSSTAAISRSSLLVCSDDEISQVDLETEYDATGPHVLGIGKVPFDRISSEGYADTTVDPGYHFQVEDSPFGGTLPIKINHERAFDEGADYYKLKVDGNEPRQMWNEYKWSTSTDRFQLETRRPASGGYYRVKQPDELWYDHWLGYRLATGGLTNGKHTIEVEFYGSTNSSSLITSETVDVRIDNQRPRAEIGEIIHHHDTDGPTPVGTCGIVKDGGDDFTFEITAEDPEGHLRSWRLTTVWGDNKSAHITSDSYEPPASGVTWNGIVDKEVPSSPWSATVSGDPTSRRCARTFYLRVWDRTINGEHYIHRSVYHKSMTLMLPP